MEMLPVFSFEVHLIFSRVQSFLLRSKNVEMVMPAAVQIQICMIGDDFSATLQTQVVMIGRQKVITFSVLNSSHATKFHSHNEHMCVDDKSYRYSYMYIYIYTYNTCTNLCSATCTYLDSKKKWETESKVTCHPKLFCGIFARSVYLAKLLSSHGVDGGTSRSVG